MVEFRLRMGVQHREVLVRTLYVYCTKGKYGIFGILMVKFLMRVGD